MLVVFPLPTGQWLKHRFARAFSQAFLEFFFQHQLHGPRSPYEALLRNFVLFCFVSLACNSRSACVGVLYRCEDFLMCH